MGAVHLTLRSDRGGLIDINFVHDVYACINYS